MKNILVLMHDDEGQEARFQAALDLTRDLDGHLTCLDVSIIPPAIPDYSMLGDHALLTADEQDREAGNRRHIETRLAAEDVPYDWIDVAGGPSAAIRDAAGMADLIVLNRDIKNVYPSMGEIAGSVVLKARRPVVAVPRDSRGFNSRGPVIIAWDGSAEAKAALHAAVPLLRLAAAVTLLECDDGSVKVPAEEAAVYLSRHGITPNIRRIRADIDAPSTILLEQVRSDRPAYLVMGGYGHGRLAEAILGGVTRRMLTECPVPLFLAH